MRLTQSAEYALRAVLFLADCRGRRATSRDIARAQSIPVGMLPHILRPLAARGIVDTQSGYKGGHRLARDASEISLREIFEAVEGPLFGSGCLLHGTPVPCGREHWCPVREVWEDARRGFVHALERTSAGELAARIGRWKTVDAVLRELAQ